MSHDARLAMRHLGASRDGREVLVDERERLLAIEDTRDDERRVVRDVVLQKEALYVVERRRIQVLRAPDREEVIRVRRRKELLAERLDHEAVGSVLVVLTALVL